MRNSFNFAPFDASLYEDGRVHKILKCSSLVPRSYVYLFSAYVFSNHLFIALVRSCEDSGRDWQEVTSDDATVIVQRRFCSCEKLMRTTGIRSCYRLTELSDSVLKLCVEPLCKSQL